MLIHTSKGSVKIAFTEKLIRFLH